MEALFKAIQSAVSQNKKLLAVLIDPENHEPETTPVFLNKLPDNVTHLFVGGSTAENGNTKQTVKSLKKHTFLPVILFPGDASQIVDGADGLLFLSLLSGRNPDYLIEQHIRAVPLLRKISVEIMPTAYILVDGGRESAVERVSGTKPLSQENIQAIVETALAGQYSGKKLIYLEAGSGAKKRVTSEVISKVKKAVDIPVIVGGGIRSQMELQATYDAGADLVVIGTAFENNSFEP